MGFTSAVRAVGSAALAGALLLGTAPAASADEIRDGQWPLKAFDVAKVWKESSGENVTVAVLDDAVNGSHPDLRKNVLPGRDMVNGGPANDEKQEDHGTNVAAAIAGHGSGPNGADGISGLAPNAKILPVGLYDPKLKKGRYTSFAEGMRYAVDEGASVINISIGASGVTKEEEQAIAYAASNDVLIVAGSGNDGARISDPARVPGVVAVGAITEAGNVWEDSNYGKQLMLTAPGDDISTAAASEPYQTASGTSLATAYVSGAAALLRAKFPDLSAGQIVNRLVKTALMPEAMGKGHNTRYGHGMIRPYRALTEDIPAGSKQGPLKAPEATLSPEPGEPGDGKGDANNEADGNQASSDESGMSTTQLAGLGVLILAGVAIVVGVVLFFVNRGKRRNGPPPPGGWGGGPGSGGPGGGGPGQAPPPQYMPPQPPAPGQYHQPGPGPYQPNQPPQGPPGY